ncbi:30S ribosomal protein S8 [Patescibacteria group bacterium]|nr:30S ribosomal protein S8 [Patescibacteria group bacterium]MBU4057511.1 30S ribosomal protein S8 [Patescibacteria group bacterium]MBU4115742.1 30S ribosomal protein S8 [Patescibacteria group bacterium]
MVNDPISDFIIKIKNATLVGKEEVSIPYSNLKYAVAVTLSKAGFVGDVAKKGKKTSKAIDIQLLYKNKKSKINDVQRISKLSRRIYLGVNYIKPIKQGRGLLILSTPKGILTDREAKKERVGGEALFKIW